MYMLLLETLSLIGSTVIRTKEKILLSGLFVHSVYLKVSSHHELMPSCFSIMLHLIMPSLVGMICSFRGHRSEVHVRAGRQSVHLQCHQFQYHVRK